MDYEIRPEPDQEEREAIVTALKRLLAREAEPPAYRSAWRERGVLENLESADDGYAAARPRSSAGATRA